MLKTPSNHQIPPPDKFVIACGCGPKSADCTCSLKYPVEPGHVSDRFHRMRRGPHGSHNPELPPSTYALFPAVVDASSRHHGRPPAMAPRSRAATVTERPRTSSGPDPAKPIGKPSFDNRISRDDLALSGRTFERANYKSYHIPIRGAAQTPDISPRAQWQSRMAPTRIATPESVDDKADMGVIAIGMALGSPAHPHGPTAVAPWQPQIQRAATAASEVQASHEEAKAKPRKWGLFGRSKSKRGKTAEVGPKRSMADTSASAASSAFSSPSVAPAVFPTKENGQNEQDRRKAPRHKPIVVRSQTEPLTAGRMEVRQDRGARNGSQHPGAREAYGAPGWNPESSFCATGGSSAAQSGHRLLDVEIPNITLERYSVMFGNLLHPRPASLLARRQATLGKLKTISDKVPEEDRLFLEKPRRATSPQPKNSPSFNLFPTTSGRPDSPHRLTPRMRSNTSPALLPSPSRETFHAPRARKGSSKVEAPAPTATSAHHRDKTPTPPVQRDHPLPLSKFHRPSPSIVAESPTVLTESPTSIDQHHEVHIRDKLRPTFTEPAWEMVSAPASSTPSSATPSRKQSPASSTSSEQTNDTKPSDDGETDKALESAVEISIARQISVSHQQRRMLGPFKASRRKDASPGGVGIAASSGAKITIGSNERLAETKSSTPTIVHPEQEMSNSPQAMHAYRKSSQGILEGA